MSLMKGGFLRMSMGEDVLLRREKERKKEMFLRMRRRPFANVFRCTQLPTKAAKAEKNKKKEKRQNERRAF